MIKNDLLAIIAPACAWIIAAMAAFFIPIMWAYWVVVILVLSDTITGVMAAGKSDIKNIKSRKAFSLAPKLIVYLLLVTVGAVAELTHKDIPFIKLILLGIGYIEVLSIDENFEKIFGFSFIKKLLEAIKSIKDIKHKKDEE